ncbi:hypothetical protein HPQ64_07365 [Rhizobiales bacterium]|uniref:hypothetical protein n=1 Tax=Hongsoonwoonella zoysiae TaxID=2821844 RepID=UPI00155F7CDC|nr:hypothetical protein [Hongsoonwoonella zoysiae]NRG17502.1 hypothetical protein [Hongsoonwoonella zoysiae]
MKLLSGTPWSLAILFGYAFRRAAPGSLVEVTDPAVLEELHERMEADRRYDRLSEPVYSRRR